MTGKTKRRLVALAAATSVGVLLRALFLEKYFFELKCIRIGKKESSRQLKILLLSDLHFKRFLDPSYKKLARLINALSPDLILIAGDVIDEDGLYAPAKAFFPLLSRSIPKVAIMGNHDLKNRVKLQTYRQLYDQNNCTLLQNETKAFNFANGRFVVTGVDDFIEGHPCFRRAVRDVGSEENHILLIHSPLQQETILEELQEINEVRNASNRLTPSYIFAGHNHGGQVCILGFPPIMPRFSGHYLKGWYNDKPPYLYLSRGFGTSTLPFRLGARSEVTLFYYGA